MQESMRKKTLSNMAWRYAERIGAQSVGFVVSIILARILLPEAYGTIALVTVFTSILQIFIDSGLANAVIQKKDADHLDFSTIFYFNIIICAVMYIGIFVAAPVIARFYGIPELVLITRVLGLTLIISGVKNVQQAYVSKTLQFRKFFFATLGGTLTAAAVGIYLAYNGAGVWALVAQSLLNNLSDTIVLWFTVKWRPRWEFSFTRLKLLFSYGWKLMLSSFLYKGNTELRSLVIGKAYSSIDLAYYNQGKKIPHLIVMNVDSAIASVLFPVISNIQDELEKVKKITRHSLRVSTYIIAPIAMGIAGIAPTLVELLLTEKWRFCIPYLQVFCVIYLFRPITSINLTAYKALGRSDLFLKLDLVKQMFSLVVLLFTMRWGVMAIAIGEMAVCFIDQGINAWPNRKLLKYSYSQQMKDIIPSLILAIFMGGMVFLIGLLDISRVFLLLIQILSGIAIYAVGSYLFLNEVFCFVLSIVKELLKKRKGEDKNEDL